MAAKKLDLPPFVEDALRTLVRAGAKATARAVDSILEDGEAFIDEVATRLKAGRATAQGIGAKPPRENEHVDVDVRIVDEKEKHL